MRPNFNIFVLGDNHFRHANIIKYCKRPFKSLKEQDEKMIKRWNSIVRPNDLVIHLGDIVMTRGKSSEVADIIKKLNGRKILIQGNHDRMSKSWYLSHKIDFIADKIYWYWNHKKILFIHNPHNANYTDLRDNDYIISGHVHQRGRTVSQKRKCILINVSVEKTNYFPMNLNSLLNKYRLTLRRRK